MTAQFGNTFRGEVLGKSITLKDFEQLLVLFHPEKKIGLCHVLKFENLLQTL